LRLDHQQQWSDIEQHIHRNIMPAIDRVLKEKNFVYTKSELKYVLQQLHRHRRENWQISLDEDKLKLDRKRKGVNSRRSDVSI
jgi:hypothetical protein